MSNLVKQRANSSWTPLNNDDINFQMFEERRSLINKWFPKWTEDQKKQIFIDLFSQLKIHQVEFLGELVDQKRPCHKQDFTRILPRALSIYIFNFLDPRSLCRCAQVCWYWKAIVDLDQIWMNKCIRLGWILPFSPSPFESGLWKRMYIENIVALKRITPKLSLSTGSLFQQLSDDGLDNTTSRSSHNRKTHKKLPPWKASDPVPRDTWRNNYLDNLNDTTQVAKLRQKGFYGQESEELVRRATNKVKTRQASPMSQPTKPFSARTLSDTTDPSILLADPMSTRYAERPAWARATSANHIAEYGKSNSAFTPVLDASKQNSSRTIGTARAHKNNSVKGNDATTEQPWQLPPDDDTED